jgi:putative DNA methylase
MAIVAEGDRARIYLGPNAEHSDIALTAEPAWRPETPLPNDPRNFWTVDYGLDTFGKLFTERQILALTTFSDLLREVRVKVEADASVGEFPVDLKALQFGGNGARAYAEAVSIYLRFCIDKISDLSNTLCRWDAGPVGTKSSTGGSARTAGIRNLFSRQSVAMTWDFGESNIFSDSGGGFNSSLNWISPAIRYLPSKSTGSIVQSDAQTQVISKGKVVSTDPPYYDNIGYADLSDFFFCWMKPSLREIYPDLFGLITTPKTEELERFPIMLDHSRTS